jgi:ABC-type oligopeptide transport system substrate-binding subunit
MDYLDPANMLGVFVFGGRHSWNNPEYDKLVKEASAMVGDPTKRAEMFHEAEKILVSDVGGAFIDFRIQGDLFQPYVAAPNCFKPDAQGVGAWHWGNDGCWGDLYITKDVMDVTTFRSK